MLNKVVLQDPEELRGCSFKRMQFFFCAMLKVPKREIFDRSDFPDFYTIKSLREGDFGVKIFKK
jgi:hypothetical protein